MNLFDDDEPIDDFLYEDEDLEEEEEFEEYPLEYEDELQEEFDSPLEDELISDELDEAYLNEEGFLIEDEQEGSTVEGEPLDIIDYEEE